MYKSFFFTIIILLTLEFLTSCTPRTLMPDAIKVHITNNIGNISKKCTFMGQIEGKNIHSNRTPFLSSRFFQEDDINYIKNEAAKLGANVAVLTGHQKVKTRRTSSVSSKQTDIITTHNIYGVAYRCKDAF